MKKKKLCPCRINWLNQKYIIADDTVPDGFHTIESYAREVLHIKLDRLQQGAFGAMASRYQFANKIEPQYVKNEQLIAVRYYKKSVLDIVFMEFAQTQK